VSDPQSPGDPTLRVTAAAVQHPLDNSLAGHRATCPSSRENAHTARATPSPADGPGALVVAARRTGICDAASRAGCSSHRAQHPGRPQLLQRQVSSHSAGWQRQRELTPSPMCRCAEQCSREPRVASHDQVHPEPSRVNSLPVPAGQLGQGEVVRMLTEQIEERTSGPPTANPRGKQCDPSFISTRTSRSPAGLSCSCPVVLVDGVVGRRQPPQCTSRRRTATARRHIRVVAAQ